MDGYDGSPSPGTHRSTSHSLPVARSTSGEHHALAPAMSCGYRARVFLKSVQFNHLWLLEKSCARWPCGQIHFIDHMHPTTPSTTSAASSVMPLKTSLKHAGGIRPIDLRRTSKPGGPGIDHGTKPMTLVHWTRSRDHSRLRDPHHEFDAGKHFCVDTAGHV